MNKAHLPGDPYAGEPGQLSLSGLAVRPWTEPDDPETKLPTPTTRAGYGLSALFDHNVTCGGGNRKTTGEETLRGLLADLLHLCDALQLDFDTVVGAAREIYQDEV